MRAVMISALALAITAGSMTTLAQTRSKSAASKSDATSEKQERSKYHRLPAHFGKLDLKEDQVEEIYAIRADYGPDIDELKAELAALQQEMNEEIQDVLTSTQRTALAKLRSGSSSESTRTVSSSRRSRSGGTTKRSSSSRRRTASEEASEDDE